MGLGPSRIQERAAILAKLQGEKRKREREKRPVEMEGGMDEGGDEGVDCGWGGSTTAEEEGEGQF